MRYILEIIKNFCIGALITSPLWMVGLFVVIGSFYPKALWIPEIYFGVLLIALIYFVGYAARYNKK